MKAWGMPSKKDFALAREVNGCNIPTGFGGTQFHADLAAHRIAAHTAKAREQEREAAKGLVDLLDEAYGELCGLECDGPIALLKTRIEAALATYRKKSGEKA